MAKEIDQGLTMLKMDLVDRLSGYSMDYSKVRDYEDELRAIVSMPPQRRKAQFNRLVAKIRSVCIKEARGG